MPSDTQVAAGKSIHRRTGKTFYLATRFLPERVRHPTYVLYGFFRIADQVVDGPDPGPPAEQRAELQSIREAVLGDADPDDPVLAAFREVADRHGIADGDIEVFLDAMEQDIDTDRYPTRAALREYMDGSAAAVGRMMTAVMDPDDPEAALPHATALGEAFQLTNFLRDVREDALDRERVYLPEETLRRFGADAGTVLALEANDGVADAVRAELERTEGLYRDGVAGIGYLPDDCQFPVLLAAVLYAEHHRLIRARGYDVLSGTPELSRPRKLAVLARTAYYWWRTGDPEATFYAASAVPREGSVDALADDQGESLVGGALSRARDGVRWL
ncbi:MAG: phytoene/squalene synthase family protein [Halobacteriaceae archaeon]